jgi:hypothetical protein
VVGGDPLTKQIGEDEKSLIELLSLRTFELLSRLTSHPSNPFDEAAKLKRLSERDHVWAHRKA